MVIILKNIATIRIISEYDPQAFSMKNPTEKIFDHEKRMKPQA